MAAGAGRSTIFETIYVTARTVAVAALGGSAFAVLGFPAPLIGGGMLAVAAATLAGLRVAVPVPLREVVFFILGVSIGSALSPEALAGVMLWPASLAILVLAVPLVTLGAGILLIRRGWPRNDAFLATAPGALATMLIVADAVGANVGRIAHVVAADATSEVALVSLGAKELQHAVVAIGDDIESSVLSTTALADIGVPDIWAKANSAAHARILSRVGAHRVVFPEDEMGRRVAHQVTGQMIDFIEIDESFALVETRPPAKLVGKTLLESDIRKDFGVTVVSIKPSGGEYTYTTPDTVLSEGSVVLVAGPNKDVERFAMQR
jgi:trk system potassium uptake protein